MFRTLVFISAQLIACSALKWSDELQSYNSYNDRSPVELIICSGDNIQLFRNYTLDNGERVTSTEWTHQPAGKTTPELMATYVEGAKGGNFVPTSPFSGRVLRLTGGGLEVSCATISESGIYRIAVTTANDVTGVTVVHRNTVRVKVVDSPKTRSGQLEVRQDAVASKDPASGELHVQLACGNFSDLGHPAVDVLWKTPTGETLRSSSFDKSSGDFQLLVPNPVKGGRYTCALDKPAAEAGRQKEEREEAKVTASTHCLEPDSALLEDASVQVDETSARFSLLEAKQQELQGLIEAKDRQFADYVTNVTDVLAERLDETLAIRNIGTVAFHAQMENDKVFDNMYRGNKDLALSKMLLNEGGAYDSVSGRFTAPANGTYFFIATTGPANNNANSRSALQIMKDGDPEPKARLNAMNHRGLGVTKETATCYATLNLAAEEQVLLRIDLHSGAVSFSSDVTSFSGFRIN